MAYYRRSVVLHSEVFSTSSAKFFEWLILVYDIIITSSPVD